MVKKKKIQNYMTNHIINLLYWLSQISKNLLFIVKRVSNIRIIGKKHGKRRNLAEQPAYHLAQLIFMFFFLCPFFFLIFFLRILYLYPSKKRLGNPTTTN